jgi:tetratricopeptide (TPR) repeat protein
MMTSRSVLRIGAAALPFLLWAGAVSFATPSARGQEKSTLDKNKQELPLAPDLPPVSAEEEAAYKSYVDAPPSDLPKKAQLGENFLQKYPQSRYRPAVYSSLTMTYLQIGDVQRMTDTGVKALEVNPNDVQVLGILGQTIPRALSKDPAVAAKQLEQAEQYARRAIEVTPTLPKPENLTDEAFADAKSQVLTMAHSGLGLVFIYRQKYSDAVAEFQQSLRLTANPDPVNYYLLGLADEKTLHYDDAASVFAKCAAIPGQMQSMCQAASERARKLALTQLSAPK